jgi:hypothetical protein
MSNDLENYGRPIWDETKAQAIFGSLVLVGVTYLKQDGSVEWSGEFFGIVTKVQSDWGIDIECHGETWNGKTMTMPPDLNSFAEASPGTYRLRSTGEQLTDPAYTGAWTITRNGN